MTSTKYIIAALCILAMALGCSSKGEAESPKQHSTKVIKSLPKILTHHFGVVRPNSKNRCSFSVQNPTDHTWMITKIETSCGCAIANATRQVLEPGDTTTIAVEYEAPSKTHDAQKYITVLMKGQGNHLLTLSLRAIVRETLCVIPESLEFGDVADSATPEKTIYVHNYSTAKWASISVASPKWCEFDIVETTVPHDTEHRPLQTWRLIATARPTQIRGAREHAVITVNVASGSRKQEKDFTASIARKRSVTVFPRDIIAFLTVDERSVTKVIHLHFSDALLAPQDDSQILFSIEPKDALVTLKARKLSPTIWQVRVVTSVPKDKSNEQSTIAVAFKNPNLHTLTIPVKAYVTR